MAFAAATLVPFLRLTLERRLLASPQLPEMILMPIDNLPGPVVRGGISSSPRSSCCWYGEPGQLFVGCFNLLSRRA
jgi:hypothetical protein